MTSTPSTSPVAKAARRVLDVVVIGCLTLVGLSTGAQLVEWWRTEPSDPNAVLQSRETDIDWNTAPVAIQFGEATTSIERIPFRGNDRELETLMENIGQTLVESSALPLTPVTEAEAEWLKSLEDRHQSQPHSADVPGPIKARPEFFDVQKRSLPKGNVYVRPTPFPSFIATREPVDGQSDSERPSQRIVAWGMGMPKGEKLWTLFVFRPDAARPGNESRPRDILLPDMARRIAHLTASDSSQWIVFQGRGDLAGWIQHFDAALGGSVIPHSIQPAREGSQSVGLKYQRDRETIDLYVSRNADGVLSGVIWSALQEPAP